MHQSDVLKPNDIPTRKDPLAAERLSRLNAISAALGEAVTADQVLDAIADQVMAATGAVTGIIALISPDGRELVAPRIKGYPPDVAERFRRMLVDAPLPVSDAVRTRDVVLIPDDRLEPRYAHVLGLNPTGPGGAMASLPLAIKGRILGGMGVRFSGPRKFTDADRDFLLAIGRQCAQALERARLYDAEHAMRAELERQAQLINLSNDAIITADGERRIMTWNEGAAAMYGYPASQAVGQIIHNLLRTESAAPVPAIERTLSETGHWEGELVQTRANGKRIVVDSRLAVVRGTDGTPTGFIEINRDITDRKQAFQGLRDSEERFRRLADEADLNRRELQSVIESMAEGLVVLDARCNVIAMNPAALRLHGFRDSADMRTHIVQFGDVMELRDAAGNPIPLENWPAARSARGEVVSNFEMTGRRRDTGESWIVSVCSVPVYNKAGELQRIVLTISDIGDRKRAEDALRQSETYFRSIAESIPHLVWSARPDGAVDYYNRRWIEYVGMQPDEIDCVWKWSKFVHPDDIERVIAAWKEALVEGREYHAEFRLRHASDGTYRWFVSQGCPLRKASGDIVRWFGTCTDIHDRKLAEERLWHAQKLESIGLLAGGIAHDFNNILTAILGNASLLAEDITPPASERLRSIVTGAERAADLTKQLLAYAGKGAFVLETLDLSSFLQEIPDLVRAALPENAELAFHLAPVLPRISADPGQVEQAIMNVVINAGEALRDKPGSVVIATSVRTISQALTDAARQEVASGNYVAVSVSDTGSGMEKATVARIFDPFFTTKFTGRGLGLAAVSGIMRAQRGGILIDTAPGRGTTFTLLFPALSDSGNPE